MGILKKMEVQDRYFKPMDYEQSHDRDIFVPAFKKVLDLESRVNRINKNQGDVSAISDLGGMLRGDPSYYHKKQSPATAVLVGANEAYPDAIDAIAKYTKKNLDDFFDLFGENDFLNLAYSIPLYKKDNDEAHNKFVDLMSEVRALREISKDPSKMEQYVREKIKECPEWLQRELNLTGDIQGLFKEFGDIVNAKLQKEMYLEVIDKDGSRKLRVDKNRIKKIVEDSLDNAWDKYNDETYESTKKDIWEADLRSTYVTIARMAYPKEKKVRDLDKDKDAVEREDERKVIGMTE